LPAVEGLVTIFGSNLADGTYQAQSIPYLTTLGPVQVLISPGPVPVGNPGTAPAELVFVSPSQINLHIPQGASGSYLTVQLNGATKSPPFFFRMAQYSPAIFFMGYDCFIDSRYEDWGKNCGLSPIEGSTYRADRGMVTDSAGMLLTSSNPARFGATYTAWLTGLGHFTNTTPPAPVSLYIANVPVYGYPHDTYIPFASADFAGPVPQSPGLYQVNFTLPTEIVGGMSPGGYPPLWPCGNYKWEISLSVNEGGSSSSLTLQTSNLIEIPLVIQNGDVPCAAN